jgi:hypothetical protein
VNFSLRHRVQTDSGARPASYAVGTGGSLTQAVSDWDVKLTTHLHLVPILKNAWSYTGISSTPIRHVLMAWCLVKYRHNFTF